MGKFKAECLIEDEKGKRTETIYIRECEDDDEAERLAKYHFINKGVVFYNAKISEI